MLTRSWCVAVALCVPALALSSAACAPKPPPPSGPIVNLSLPDDAGRRVAVPVPGARAPVIDLWAPSCEPCKAALPALVAREPDISANGAALLLVAVLAESEGTDEARQTLASWGIEHRFLVDRGDSTRQELFTGPLPTTALLDASGRVVRLAHEEATPDAVVRAAAAVRSGR